MNKTGMATKIGNKVFFSFLYMAGDINKISCINKKGKAKINDANNDIFRLDKKTSGKAVKIILLSSSSFNKSKRGCDRNSPMIEAL